MNKLYVYIMISLLFLLAACSSAPTMGVKPTTATATVIKAIETGIPTLDASRVTVSPTEVPTTPEQPLAPEETTLANVIPTGTPVRVTGTATPPPAGSGIPGIDSYIQVQDGRIRVTDVERADSFTYAGQTATARPGYELIFVSVAVEGEVPLALGEGVAKGLIFGEWALVDANGDRYTPGGLVEGKLIFQVKKPARDPVLWLGDEVSIPLGPFLGNE